eukprot:Em0157g2a
MLHTVLTSFSSAYVSTPGFSGAIKLASSCPSALQGRSRKKKASVRDSYKADPEKKKASIRDSYKADPEKKKASVRDSYKADPERRRPLYATATRPIPKEEGLCTRQLQGRSRKEGLCTRQLQGRFRKKASQKYEDNSAAIKASERHRYWNDPAVRLANVLPRGAVSQGSPNITTTTQAQERYKADPEKKKASVRDSYKADPEKKKASVRDSYKADPEKKKASVRDSYNADIESKQSAKRQRYQEDLEENRAAKRQRYQEDLEENQALKAEIRGQFSCH